MSESTSEAPPRRSRRRKWRLVLLALALLLAAAFGWTVRESRRARVRRTVLPELARLGVEPTTFGLTTQGIVAAIVLGHERGDGWLREHVGEGWFARPVEFLAGTLNDDEVAYVVERLQRLGKVYTIQFRGRGMSERGVEAIQAGLPDTLILIHTPEGERLILPRNRRLFVFR
jgi:hypothetical protein